MKIFTVSSKSVKADLYMPDTQSVPASITRPSQTYFVPLVLRAIHLRADAIASIPAHIHRGSNEVPWPFPQQLQQLLWKTEAFLLLHGSAFWLKLKRGNRIVGIQFLNPLTVSVKYDDKSNALTFIQQVNGRKVGEWGSDEIVFFREFNPFDDLTSGVAIAEVVLNDARLLTSLQQFAAEFFENGAMPAVLLGIERNVAPAEVERIESFFRRALSSVKRAWRAVAVRGEITPQVLTPPFDKLALPELRESARAAIALAFGIPETMLTDAANYATAREHRLSFWQDTIAPRARMFESVINEQLLAQAGYSLELAVDELSVFQEDENERAASLQALVNAGVPLVVAMQMLGFDLPPGWQYDNENGRIVSVKSIHSNMSQHSNVSQNDELQRWYRKSYKRLKANRSPAVSFESEHIAPLRRESVASALEVSRDVQVVKAVFNAAIANTTAGDYP